MSVFSTVRVLPGCYCLADTFLFSSYHSENSLRKVRRNSYLSHYCYSHNYQCVVLSNRAFDFFIIFRSFPAECESTIGVLCYCGMIAS